MKAAQPGPAPAPQRPDFEATAPTVAAAAGDSVTVARRELPPRNALLSAAEPLLALAASVRAGRAQIDLARLHGLVTAEIARFGDAVRGSYSEEHVKRAAYALCATADDVAMNLPGQPQAVAEWARRSMTVKYFSEAIGGDRFWTLLDQMIARPREYTDVLELFHACLACGFLGRYRVLPNGRAEHQAMMQRAYQALDHVRNISPTELSPRWRGVRAELSSLRFWTPLAFAAAGMTALLVLMYIGLRLALWHTGAPAYASLAALEPPGPLQIVRAMPVETPPPPSSTQLERIEGFLAPEIREHLVRVLQTPKDVVIRTTVPSLFDSGSKDISRPQYLRLIQRIAAAVEHEHGYIHVTGHTDIDKISTPDFPDNMALSEARAKTVADIISARISDAARISHEGFGEIDPIDSNNTIAGKSRNRRVEIAVPRDRS